MMDDRIAFVRGYCSERAAEIARQVAANELEAATIERFARTVLHGSKFIDLHVRVDGREYHFEADWLARLFRPPAQGMPREATRRECGSGASAPASPVRVANAPKGAGNVR